MSAVSDSRGAARSPWPLRLWAALALAALSGVLYVGAFPGSGWWPLGFVALVPLLLALRGQSAATAALIGLTAGVVTTTAGFWWLLELLQRYSGFPLPLCVALLLALSVLQAGRYAMLGLLAARAERNGWPVHPSFALAYAAAEAVYPLLFPWYFGAILHRLPAFIQVADIGGPILVSLALVSANLALSELLQAAIERRRPERRRVLIEVAVPLACLVYGGMRVLQIDAQAADSPKFRVGIVQGNVPMDLRSDLDAERALARQLELSDQLEASGIDLLIWGESAYPYVVSEAQLESNLREALGQRAVPLLLGAVVVRREGEVTRRFNSALLLDQTGALRGRYDKQYLLPFGEYLPLGGLLPFLYDLSPASGRFESGDSLRPLPFEDKRISALICYEDVLPGFVREAVSAAQPHLLINLTNDAWFGDSAEPWAHLALSQLRAVEHRRFLVRATNSGVSALIDPAGRVLQHSGPMQEAALRGEVGWMHGSTVYGWLGDAPWFAATIVSIAAAIVRRRRVAAE